jgi:hypothetical protein
MLRYLRPVLGQHALAEGVAFDLSDGGHASPLEAEVQGADTGAEGEDVHDAALFRSSTHTGHSG